MKFWTNAVDIFFLEPNGNYDEKCGLLLLNKYFPDSDKGSCPVVHSVAWCDRITFVCWKLVTKSCCCLPEVETCKMYTAELTCTTLYVCTYICSCHAITTWETLFGYRYNQLPRLIKQSSQWLSGPSPPLPVRRTARRLPYRIQIMF